MNRKKSFGPTHNVLFDKSLLIHLEIMRQFNQLHKFICAYVGITFLNNNYI